MTYEPLPTELGDINLDNYYLDNQFYNTFTYVHKKFLPKSNKKKFNDGTVHINDVGSNVQDKSKQYYLSHGRHSTNEKKKAQKNLHDDSVVEQTVKFAKQLAPQLVPPSREFSPTPVYYTVKTCRKSGKKLSRFPSTQSEYELKLDKEKLKPAKKGKRLVQSPREDISHSSQDNTLDEIQTNNSSTFSLSDVIENNLNKAIHRKRKHDVKIKPIVSNCIEGITNGIESTNQSEIKIHIMNDAEKNNFYESLRVPIVNSVKEYLNEIKNPSEISADLQILSQTLASHTQKIDHVIKTLDKIEKKLSESGDKTTRIIMSPKPISSKGSRLEELAEDLPEIKEVNTSDEDDYEANYRKAKNSRSVVETINPNYVNNSNWVKQSLDHGEDVPVHMNATCSQVGKQDAPNRIPARFCWTDASRKF